MPTSFPKGIAFFGTPVTDKFIGLSDTPGVAKKIIDVTVGAGLTRTLISLKVACRSEGRYKVLVDSVQVGSGRTGAAQPTDDMLWFVGKEATAGQKIEVFFTARSGSPSTQDLEAYLEQTEV